ncbi:HD phosphohydrolase domain-containing protein [Rhizophagus clarus]|uniref:HD phosphohydrolase domain-containing protein n=1 Tax=Rhizophagus clarus TaxID=94130 RepID=A0A8H3LU01_9GLOM|nr:HD phosphohydrolase domain-containing protein [Rhizophagus clarus]
MADIVNGKNKKKKYKRIQDPIHGLMEFNDWIIKFIDTEHFQRLRNIKQLGTTYYVYPGAIHSRFEHCLGVAYLARSLVKRISEKQPELKCNKKDLKCVTLAALCHDLGHGPFSHLFESFIKTVRPDRKWEHEDASKMMFDDLIKKHKDVIGDLNEEDIQFVKDLISGKKTGDRSLYLFDVVANERNSIDVDKFDYLARDCYYLGMKSVFDSSRLMNYSHVSDNQITYDFKESYNIYELFHTRYSLHKKAYNHRVGKAIGYMIIDALIAADPVLKISDSIDNPDEYLKMDDTILNRIEYSDDTGLKKSREIIRRIRRRELYKFVDEFLVPKNLKKEFKENQITTKKIIAHDNGLKEEDVIVDILVLNYGKKDENPIDNVEFYDKNQPGRVFKLESSQVSYLVPEQFEELNIRIFTRDRSKIKIIRKYTPLELFKVY